MVVRDAPEDNALVNKTAELRSHNRAG